MIKLHVFFAATLLLSTLSNASSHQELIGGEQTTLYKSTIYVLLGPAKCTATKIAPRTYLTAAHCMTSRKLSKTPTKLKRHLGHGSLIYASSKSGVTGYNDLRMAYINTIHVHPSYDHYRSLYAKKVLDDWISTSLALDIAVFTIINEFKDIPSAEISFDKIENDEEFSVIGYGCEDNFKDASVPQGYLGRRKIGVKVTSTLYDDSELKYLPKFVKKNLTEHYIYSTGILTNDSKVSICLGDSGGPIYQNNKIVGVSSFAYANDDGHPINNFFTRLSYEQEWLKDFIKH